MSIVTSWITATIIGVYVRHMCTEQTSYPFVLKPGPISFQTLLKPVAKNVGLI